jgi:hypothetical protein
MGEKQNSKIGDKKLTTLAEKQASHDLLLDTNRHKWKYRLYKLAAKFLPGLEFFKLFLFSVISHTISKNHNHNSLRYILFYFGSLVRLL